MTPQVPAEGIMKTGEYGDAKVYKVVCSCGQDDHSHSVWIESDDHEVSVNIYATVKTNFWSKTRWQHIWTLLTKGYVDCETTVCMTVQQAVNYSETLKSAIKDVKLFKEERAEKSKIAKLAEQGDCE